MFIAMNNVVGGGDNWVVGSDGAPVKKILTDTSADNQVVFDIPSLEYGYIPFVNVADGQPYPKHKSDPVFNSTNMTMTITYPKVTDAQKGGSSGEQCYVQLRVVK